MVLLESAWFFRMVEQQGHTPKERLLAVFSVLDSWLAAPGIREQFVGDFVLYQNRALADFMTRIATSARARQPENLADQLMILLRGAIAEDLRDPKSGAIGAAGKAAQVIIAETCAPRNTVWHWAAGGMAAAFAAIAVLVPMTRFAPIPEISAIAVPATVVTQQDPSRDSDGIEAALALQEKIASGICPAPELVALPPGQATAYMNAINLRAPDDPVADRENLHAFLAWFDQTRATECYPRPSNGHTRVVWVTG
ncbi:MAG: hypothetical protein LBV44_09115 [Methylobacillus sp.]|jgi:hypothetical protein|nr:hypothetical protein [Methylobacillus sp.]